MTKAQKLRQALSKDKPVAVIGGHDGMGAKLAESAGFDAVWASGLEISTSAGLPDANILTMTDFLRAAREMNAATSLPIVCDCDTGFGNSNNVIHMVSQYESAGIAAVCIEDKLFPKVNSFVPGRQELATPWEFAGKIMAAKQAQELPDLVVIARLESLIAGHGLDDALRRADTYNRAGADMILIHSKAPTAEPVLEFLKRWKRQSPVVVVPTTYPELTLEEWQAQGVSMVIYANHGIRAAIGAMETAYKKILDTGRTMELEQELVSLSKVFDLQGMPAMKINERRFLKNLPGSNVRASILAGGTLIPGDLKERLGGEVTLPLLDIYGRTLLQRQLDALGEAGVTEIALLSSLDTEVVGTQGVVEAVASPGTGLMGTINAALECDTDLERTLLCYCDVLVEAEAITKLLESNDDIVLMVDRTYQEVQSAPRKASLDLIQTEPPPPTELRALNTNAPYTVKSISKEFELSASHFEFVGLVKLSAQGKQTFKESFARYQAEESTPGETEHLSFNAFLNKLLADGVNVRVCEVRRGWVEIHDFEDYRSAVEQFRTN